MKTPQFSSASLWLIVRLFSSGHGGFAGILEREGVRTDQIGKPELTATELEGDAPSRLDPLNSKRKTQKLKPETRNPKPETQQLLPKLLPKL
jgi:hypothetical protein